MERERGIERWIDGEKQWTECKEMKNESQDEMSMFNHMLFYGQSVVSAHGIESRTSGRLKNFSNGE